VGEIRGFALDYAYGAAWFSNLSGTQLQRVDIATHKVTTSIPMQAGAVTHGAEHIWVALANSDNGGWDGGIAKVDPRSGQRVETIKVASPGPYPSLVFAYGALWLQGGGKPYFLRIDPGTHQIRRFPIPSYQSETDLQGGDIVAGMNSVWMQTAPDTIGRFSPRTGTLMGHYPADSQGGGAWALPAYGSLWVANFDTSTLWRDRIT
jgi:streptogramin lyase